MVFVMPSILWKISHRLSWLPCAAGIGQQANNLPRRMGVTITQHTISLLQIKTSTRLRSLFHPLCTDLLHGSIVAAACRAGKHILIEKPFAVSVAEAQRISAIIDASPIRCMVAQTLRFNSVVQTLKQHLPAIAPLHSLHLSQPFEPSSLAWLDRKAESGGRIILHTGVHSFDLLYFLSGQATTQVWCQTKTIFTHETEDNFQMYGRTADPLLTVQVSGSRSTQSRSGLIEIIGENGQLVGDHAHNFAYLLRGRERIPVSVPPPVPTVKEAVQAFVDAIKNDTPFPVTVEDGLRAVAIAEACYRSAETGRSLAVG